MKKIFTTLLLVMLTAGFASAQDESEMPGRNYINIGYVKQTVDFEKLGKVPGYEWGASLEFGRTFFFNARNPLAGMVRFGLDLSYLDLQYANFKEKYEIEEIGDLESNTSHFANIGMQVGPSVTVTPIKDVHAKAYVHYAPSFAVFADNSWENIFGGYAGYVTGGVQVSYKFLTVGVEFRGSSAKFSSIVNEDDLIGDIDDIEDIEDIDDISLGDFIGDKQKVKLPSTRFIVGFRF